MTAPQGEGTEPDVSEDTPSNWEFLHGPPTKTEVQSLLDTLPRVWGVGAADLFEYVQALPQQKKVKRPHPTNPNLTVETYVEAHTLYMSVAGRIAMMNRAAEMNGWRVEVTPEPVTPTGIPGYLSIERRLVFRVYVTIWMAEEKVGTRFGTAWVPAEGGSGASASNPYEKVETSALGRALGTWGFGVLPGSGIATVEEMAAIRTNRAALDGGSAGESARKPRDEVIAEALLMIERVRQVRGYSNEQMAENVVAFLRDRLGIAGASASDDGVVEWGPVKDGQIVLLTNSLKETLRKAQDAESGL